MLGVEGSKGFPEQQVILQLDINSQATNNWLLNRSANEVSTNSACLLVACCFSALFTIIFAILKIVMIVVKAMPAHAASYKFPYKVGLYLNPTQVAYTFHHRAITVQSPTAIHSLAKIDLRI